MRIAFFNPAISLLLRTKDAPSVKPEDKGVDDKPDQSVVSSMIRKRGEFLFVPNRRVYSTPEECGIKKENYDDVEIKTPDGETLKGFFIKAPNKDTRKTIIFFNGQGGNASECLKEIKRIHDKVPANILIVDYRGFGKSSLKSGSITEEDLITDGKAMYDYLIKCGYKPEDISFFGVSLGGGIATAVAREKDVDMLFIQSSFTTTSSVAGEQVDKYNPFSGGWGKAIKTVAKVATYSKFNSLWNIEYVKAKKVIVCHGNKDSYIPCSHGQQLFEKVKVKDKQWFELEGSGHSNFLDFYTDEIYDTVNKHLGLK